VRLADRPPPTRYRSTRVRGYRPSDDHPRREVITTAISISLIALLGVAVWALYKFAALKLWHGLVCMLFGFYLASSSVAPEIRTTVASIIRALTGHN
jgi:O-antigen ligase